MIEFDTQTQTEMTAMFKFFKKVAMAAVASDIQRMVDEAVSKAVGSKAELAAATAKSLVEGNLLDTSDIICKAADLVADDIDTSDIVSKIDVDYDELARTLDASDVASYIEVGDVAEAIDVSDVADNVDVEAVAEAIDYRRLAKAMRSVRAAAKTGKACSECGRIRPIALATKHGEQFCKECE